MKNISQIKQTILGIQSEEDFNQQALDTFHFQFNHIPIYHQFCVSLHKTNPQHYTEIPFLPISFFKTHAIYPDTLKQPSLVFKSSGTTQSGLRSQHYITYPELYEASFVPTFTSQIASPSNAIIFALLPNYLEQGNSSLVYMVDFLIKQTKHPLSGFYLNNYSDLLQAIQEAKQLDKEIILFGVSYALLDLIDLQADLRDIKIIETGGMKGRRKEMTKDELHDTLKKGFNVKHIYSEYGMTELLSQAYLTVESYFHTPPWMRILIRDINDPLQVIDDHKTGGINVIDLANYYSCSFIATDDLGQTNGAQFKVLGRFDNSDIRGCNLLIG